MGTLVEEYQVLTFAGSATSAVVKAALDVQSLLGWRVAAVYVVGTGGSAVRVLMRRFLSDRPGS